MGEFSGKVVLVTGAGRGYGREIAAAFAAHGAIVAANDLTPINLDITLDRIRAAGGRVKQYLYDIAVRMQAQAMVDEIIADWGRLDILVNNAGVEPRYSLLDMDEWDWKRTLDVNLSGPFFLIQAGGRVMAQQGGGAIVNLGFADNKTDDWGNRAAFISSKMGLIGLTRVAAQELSPDQIRVNMLLPVRRVGGDPSPLNLENIVEDPVNSAAVAAMVVFLCGRDSEYLSGDVVYLDGERLVFYDGA
jgi:NAD(P)-dependent dehydrogenase (short-subunit alcohol dehydrogenase family)